MLNKKEERCAGDIATNYLIKIYRPLSARERTGKIQKRNYEEEK